MMRQRAWGRHDVEDGCGTRFSLALAPASILAIARVYSWGLGGVGALSGMILATTLGAFLFRRVYLGTDLPFERSAISRLPGPHPEVLASTGMRWLYANNSSATGSSPAALPSSADTR